jgi:nucleotide-binding universal stress UspA family protein
MKIVVGYKGTDEGKAALAWAIREVKKQGGELFLVHSLRGGTRPETEEQQVWQAREELEEAEGALAESGVKYAVRKYMRGKTPAEDINDAVAKEGAELIVIGIRRRSRTGKLLLGSDALEILIEAACPVVSVKAEE